jgi:hypothetical protein
MIKLLKNCIFVVVGVVILVSCYETDLESIDVTSVSDINYEQGLITTTSDPFQIIAIIPRDTQWDAIVEYNGGCGNHIFNVVWNGTFDSNASVATKIALVHNANGDQCKALIRDTVSFNVRRATNWDYALENATIEIINGAHTSGIIVDPNLAKITTDKCDLKGTIVKQECEEDAWQGHWIVLSDSVPHFGEVWLQPVRINQDALAYDPKGGNALLSVSVLFGYDYLGSAASDLSCKNPDKKISLPVSIQCYQPQ